MRRRAAVATLNPDVTEDEPPRHKEHQEGIGRNGLRRRISKSISNEVSGLAIWLC